MHKNKIIVIVVGILMGGVLLLAFMATRNIDETAKTMAHTNKSNNPRALLNEWFASKSNKTAGSKGNAYISMIGEDDFSWFVYHIFIDPGPYIIFFRGNAVFALNSDEVNQRLYQVYFECKKKDSFGKAIILLYEERKLMFLQLGWEISAPGQEKLTPELIESKRSRLETIAKLMRRVMAEPGISSSTKEMAHMTSALVEGKESRSDSISTGELEKIITSYPNSRFTAFLSRYYLFKTLLRRSEKDEAYKLAETIRNTFKDNSSIRKLSAYKSVDSYIQSKSGKSITKQGK